MDMQGANPAAFSVGTMERIRPYQFRHTQISPKRKLSMRCFEFGQKI